MSNRAQPAGLTELADAILECAAPITLILDHMARSPTRPEPAEARAVLRDLVRDVREPRATASPPRALRTTTAVWEAPVPLMVEELMLVTHEPVPPLRRDPRSGHRRRLRPPSLKRRRPE